MSINNLSIVPEVSRRTVAHHVYQDAANDLAQQLARTFDTATGDHCLFVVISAAFGLMTVAAAPSCDRWKQRAIEELGEMQYGSLPRLSQKLALPVDMRTRWLIDQRTAAAAGAYDQKQRLIIACCSVGCYGARH